MGEIVFQHPAKGAEGPILSKRALDGAAQREKALLYFYRHLARKVHRVSPVFEDAGPPFDLAAEFFDLGLIRSRGILKPPDLLHLFANGPRKFLLLAICALKAVHHLRALGVQSF
jgi:hypothetical protein